jgi:hypothetical protein
MTPFLGEVVRIEGIGRSFGVSVKRERYISQTFDRTEIERNAADCRKSMQIKARM